MPRAFTEDERQGIRERLMRAGRGSFLRYGLKKTTVQDLVQPVGIAKATFYLFFESKEELFVEVILHEIPQMIQRLMRASFETTDDTREALIRFMRQIAVELHESPLASILLGDSSQIQSVLSQLNYQQVLTRVRPLYAPVVNAIETAQERGDLLEEDPMRILACLGLIKLIPLGEKQIPKTLYNAMMELAPQIIADGLTCPRRKGRTL